MPLHCIVGLYSEKQVQISVNFAVFVFDKALLTLIRTNVMHQSDGKMKSRIEFQSFGQLAINEPYGLYSSRYS